MPYSYNKLRGRIIEKYGSQKRFAEVLGKSENSVSKKMNCGSEFSQTDINDWAKLLDIPNDEYLSYFFA